MHFVKMEGCGNDYVYVDVGLTRAGEDPAGLGAVDALARAVSDRHYGIGSDGLILLSGGEKAPVRMRMWNADGSEGALCLNGLRCAAKYAAESVEGLPDTFPVETASRTLSVTVHRGERGMVDSATVVVGKPDFRREALPAAGSGEEIWGEPFYAGGTQVPGYAVSVGNPHLALWMDEEEAVHRALLEEIGPPLETHERFPRGINVHLVAGRKAGGLVMRSWERGSGITLACGSGAVAAFAVAHRLGRAPAEATVAMPGGEVSMRAEPDGTLVLTGPAREVFRGIW